MKNLLDAFSGSTVVAYMYKTKGLKVFANDRSHYCFHLARAIIENNNVHLSADEIEALLQSNAKAGEFVQTAFRGKIDLPPILWTGGKDNIFIPRRSTQCQIQEGSTTASLILKPSGSLSAAIKPKPKSHEIWA